MATLHSAGIHHRAIKPAKVLVEHHSGSPILMDLGVVSDFLLVARTQTRDFLGTGWHAEPGYLTGSQFTAASDWYSVGLIGYELFFGKRFSEVRRALAKIVAKKVSPELPMAEDLAKRCEELTEGSRFKMTTPWNVRLATGVVRIILHAL